MLVHHLHANGFLPQPCASLEHTLKLGLSLATTAPLCTTNLTVGPQVANHALMMWLQLIIVCKLHQWIPW